MQDLDFQPILRAWPFLLEGLGLSFLLTAAALVGGLLIGSALAAVRLFAGWAAGMVAAGYVNLFRSVPLILVIFWFYFLVPLLIGRPIGPFWSVLIAFTLFETAFFCEIIRAGISAVPRGQIAAARAHGLSLAGAMRWVVLPQAIRHMTPVLLTQAIILFQDTSLVYVVALKDFLTSASLVANRDGTVVEAYLVAALVYLVLCFGASRGVQALQRKAAA